MQQSVFETDFSGLNLVKRGKVRDIYDLGKYLLMVATDRISAFDVIMPDPIPGKGRILNKMSMFWFQVMESIIQNHLVSGDVTEYPDSCKPYREILSERSMLVKKAEPLPVECIVRGYISGSGWQSYKESGSICGIKLPGGLKESDKLPETIFTPSTKGDIGEHDVNIDYKETVNIIGEELARRVKELSIEIYEKGTRLADKKGIIIADTKFEFGLIDNEIIFIDEILTPDSSRFWPRKSYNPGKSQESFDKQYIRDYLISINWDKNPPAPHLPDEVIKKTQKKYASVLKLLTG